MDRIINEEKWTIAPGADLHGADLRWADLDGADLREATLHGADLRDTCWIDSGEESRGYRMGGIFGHDGELLIVAGRHQFTVKEARAHWGSPDYHDTLACAQECLRRVDLIEAVWTIRQAAT